MRRPLGVALAMGLTVAACGSAETVEGSRRTPSQTDPSATQPAEPDGSLDDSDGSPGDAANAGSDPDSSGSESQAEADPPDIDPESWLLGGWSAAGAEIATDVVETRSIADFGAVPDDDRSDSAAFAAAVASVRTTPDRPVAIEIPAGTFLLTETLSLRSGVVLRGRGPETSLVIDFSGSDEPGITATGKPAAGWFDVVTDVAVGSTTVELGSTGGLRVGQLVEIEQRTNPEKMYTKPEWRVDWDAGSIGELNRIVAIDGASITLASPLNGSYRASMATALRRIDPVAGVGIEDLSISRVDDGYGNTMAFSFATDVWLRRVESRRTTRAHVSLDQIYRCSIDDSVFHDASDFGDGGRAYGISLARHATACLVTDNTLYDLRHAIIIQLGASGNVVAYNDARGSAGYADRQPRADLSLHGHWPQANLFEGNIFDRVVFADWWGPSGPSNTLFRNCVLDHVLVADESNDQLIIGNLIRLGGLNIESGITGTTLIANGGDDSTRTLVPDSLVALAGLDAATGKIPIDPNQGFDSCQASASQRSPFSG